MKNRGEKSADTRRMATMAARSCALVLAAVLVGLFARPALAASQAVAAPTIDEVLPKGGPDTGTGCFDERAYLERYPDVRAAVRARAFDSGRQHYLLYGRNELRLPCAADDHIPRVRQWLRNAVLVVLLGVVAYAIRRRRWEAPASAVAMAAAIGVFAYLDYLIGRRVFIFHDIATDTLVQAWPLMNHIAERLWSGDLPFWSFGLGLGQNVFPTVLVNPIDAVAVFSGKTLLPHLLGYLQVAKILIAVGFMAAYLRLRGYEKGATVLAALSFGFCGHMVSRGTWYMFGTEVALASFYLFALERFVQTGRFVMLALATALLATTPYYTFLYGSLGLLYVLVRIFGLAGARFAGNGRILAGFVAISVVGVGLALVILLPDLINTVGSARVSGEGGVASAVTAWPLLTIESAQLVLAGVARALSPNLLGNANRFSGALNYLEAPLAYAGVLALVSVIPAALVATRRQRVLIAVFVAAALAFHVLTYFRVVLNAFSGAYFRQAALWIPFGLSVCLATAIDGLERPRRGARVAIGLSVGVVILMAALVHFMADKLGYRAAPGVEWAVVGLAVGYGALLAWPLPTSRGVNRAVLLAPLLAFELAGTSLDSIGKGRSALDGLYPFVSAGYADSSTEVIRRIEANDPSPHRIERQRDSVFLADSLMQGYFGTTCYMSFTSPSQVRFRRVTDLLSNAFPRAEAYFTEITPRPLLMPLLGIRYYLADDAPRPPGYALRLDYGGLKLYSSTARTSLAYFFPRATTEAAIEKLTQPERQVAMISAAVLTEPPRLAQLLTGDERDRLLARALPGCRDTNACFDGAAVDSALGALGERAIEIEHFEQNRIRATVSADEPGVAFFSIPRDQGWSMVVDGRPTETLTVNYGFIGVELDRGRHVIELSYRPPGLLPGAIAGLASALVLIAAAVVARRVRSRPTPA